MIGMDLSGQVAVVTGASGELGRVISPDAPSDPIHRE